MGAAGAGGDDHVVHPQPDGLGLVGQLLHRQGVGHGAQAVGAAQRDDVGTPAGGRLLVGDALHDPLPLLGLAGKDAHVGAQQVIDEQVAGEGLGGVAAQHQDALEAGSDGGGRRQPRVVGLEAAGGEDHLRPFGQGVGHQQLQLAHLVAAQGQAGLVVALDPEGRAAQPGREARQRVKRRGKVSEREPGKLLGSHHVPP